jgi:hypothetical protein
VGVRDLLLLAWATICAFLPGLTVLAALRRFSPSTAFGGAPAVTVGLLYLTSVLTGASGLRFGLLTAAVLWVAVLAAAVLFGRAGATTPVRPRLRVSAVPLVGVISTAVAVALGLRTWLGGIGPLDTIPQEHDEIIHTELIAVIMRTGRAAPWQSFPVDVLTGHPGSFYPNGFHLYAALVGAFAGNPVRALNAAMVVLFAVALPIGVAALGLRLRPRSVAPVVAAGAAVVAAVSYHPLFALMHDGGILANAAAFAVAPGAVALVLSAASAGAAGVAAVALLVCGVVLVHPTAIGTVGWTAGTWLVVERLVAKDRWLLLRRALGTVLGGVAVAAVVLVPYFATAQSQAARVAAEPRDIPVQPLAQAVGITLTAPYGGYVDPSFHYAQAWIAALFLLGTALCLWCRVNAALVATIAVWSAVVTGFLIGARFAPIRLTSDLYYNGYTRIVGGLSIVQWLACGVTVATVVAALVRLGLRVLRHRRTPWLRPVLAGAVLLALLVAVLPYLPVNEQAVARRWRNPEFVRADGNDLAAARYIARQIQPGMRVMNNANDGSTYGYVYYGLPVVEVEAIGAPGPEAVYTYDLLKRFNRLDQDPHIASLVCRLRIGWAVVDSEAPLISAPPSLFPGGYYALAPGLGNLERTTYVSQAARFGDVTVYRVDLAALGCA